MEGYSSRHLMSIDPPRLGADPREGSQEPPSEEAESLQREEDVRVSIFGTRSREEAPKPSLERLILRRPNPPEYRGAPASRELDLDHALPPAFFRLLDTRGFLRRSTMKSNMSGSFLANPAGSS